MRGAREHGETMRVCDIAYTFAVGRADLERRVAVPADTVDVLLSGLDTLAAGPALPWRRCRYDLRIDRLHRQGFGTAAHEPALPQGHLRDFGLEPGSDFARMAARDAGRTAASESGPESAALSLPPPRPETPCPHCNGRPVWLSSHPRRRK
ncbi:KS-MAT linker domain-containing protein [Streptomyces sp. NPDC002851]